MELLNCLKAGCDGKIPYGWGSMHDVVACPSCGNKAQILYDESYVNGEETQKWWLEQSN